MDLQTRLESRSARVIVGVAIVTCAAVVGIESSSLAALLPAGLLHAVDVALTLFFVVEVALRWASEGARFFAVCTLAPVEANDAPWSLQRVCVDEHAFWNVFDLTVSALGAAALVLAASEHAEFVFAARLLRVFRVLRLFELGPGLRRVERQIVAVIPTVFTFIALLSILLYVFAIFGTQLFADASTDVANFSSLEKSFLTLFQVMTLDGWSDVMRDVARVYPLLGPVYFVAFIVSTAIVSLNVFIAMLNSQVEDAMSRDRSLDAAAAPIGEVLETEGEILRELVAVRERLELLERRLSARSENPRD